MALGETPPRHAGHAVQPSQYAVTVPQYGVASFCTSDSQIPGFRPNSPKLPQIAS